MLRRKHQRRMSIFLTLLMFFSIFTSAVPAFAADTSEGVRSPVVDNAGNVTFHAEHDGDNLYVVGSMNEWDIDNAIPMEKQNGFFTTTVNLTPERYEYKFTLAQNWDEGDFVDPLNPNVSGGNSVLYVPGVKVDQIPGSVKQGSETTLTGDFINEGGTTSAVTPEWSLVTETPGVALVDNVLTVASDAEVGKTFIIQAQHEGYVSEREVSIVSGLNEYIINYYRHDGNAMDWDMWIFGSGLNGAAYDFTTVDGEFAQGTYEFEQDQIDVITRLGNWESQESDRRIRMPEGENQVEVWFIQGDDTVYYDKPQVGDDPYYPPTVRFVYDRENKDYEDWNIWVWNTGARNDQIDFDEIGEVAIANIEVGASTRSMGFKLRKGTEWDQVDVDEDRTIAISPTEKLTKVSVTEGEYEFRTVPFASGPSIDQGSVSFFYRDAELYREDAMDTLDSVQVKLDGQVHDMIFEENKERFTLTLNNLEEGTYEYTFLVTKDGQITEINDPYNTNEDGVSIVSLSSLDMDISAEVTPSSINYNQNAVLSLDVTDFNGENMDPETIREIFVDLSVLGGKERTKIDPELNALTIAVREDISTGTKELPITVVDIYGGQHEGAAEIHIEPRVIDGDGDFDWDEARIYFMLTDRFADGDESNNVHYGYDPTSPGSYQGGDFKGITQNLDYLDDLGINTIWITPIVENVYHNVEFNADQLPYYAYHGYWALNFEELNPHLGTLEDFHELIDAASDRDMKIMVDVVLNHTGYGLKLEDGNIENHPEGFPTDDDREKFADMLRQDGGDGSETRGELAGLPDFITEDEAVREQIVDWQVGWLQKATTPNGNTIDYFRVDTVKHVEDTTWMHFKNELTLEKPEFKMIGEAWGAGANNQYARHYLDAGMMDSLLDFDFKYIARDLVNGQIESVNRRIQERNDSLTNTATLGHFLGSHDEEGFLHLINDPENTSKLKVAAALQITSKGQPVIYYGEELGLSGEDNWPYYDNRYVFPWYEVEGNDLHAHYQTLLNIRSDYSHIFSKGTHELLAGNNAAGHMIFKRSFDGKSAVVGINTKNEAEEVTFTVPFSAGSTVEDVYNGTFYTVGNDKKVTVTLPAKEDGATFILVSSEEDDRDEITVPPVPENTLRIHYQRDDNDFTNLGLWLWEDVVSPSENWPSGGTPFVDNKRTDYGAYLDIPINSDARKVGFIVLDTSNGDKDGEDKVIELFSPQINEVWIQQGSDEVHLVEPIDLPENTIRIHYDRAEQDYDGWGAWIWGDVISPSDDWPVGAQDAAGIGKYGAYFDIELIESAEEIGFLFVHKNSDAQTTDYHFSLLEYNQIFITHGDDQVYTNPYGSIPTVLLSGEVLSDSKIQLRFSKTDGLTEEEVLEGIVVIDRNGNEVMVENVTIIDERLVELNGTFDLEAMPFSVTYGENTISATGGWRMMDEMFAYEGELGAKLHADGTATLKLWSPKADDVSVVLYDKDDQNKVVGTIDMTLGDRGVWQVTLDKDNTSLDSFRGYFYHYSITHEDETKLALDPYAKSMATWADPDRSGGEYPIGKAAIVDPSTIGPELDFANIPGFEKREDAIIYEVHVRDFTSDYEIADELEAEWGTFAAFIERLDYIQDLGVTHIQLLPIMSYFFADEFNKSERLLEWSSTQNNYNWGYDPHSYFSITGMYSENPDDPEWRIEEFKKLIDEIHSREMGVILDVVYNHTARVGIFEDLVPNYYHFMDADGTPRTSFGGGRLGTTHEMARRILVDSIMYWVQEFKVDGFRFDMMGDHDAESIQIAYDKAKAVNPNVVMIGEGWRTFVGDEGDPVQAADQDWMQYTESVGVFSDEFRNELKSGFGSEGQPRFLTNGARNIQQIFDNIRAQPHNFTATHPGDVVPYIEAHDNLTLYDVIAQSIMKDPEIPENDYEIHQRIRLGNTMVLTSQGTAFIHAGQEFGRTKQFRAETDEAPYKSTYMTDEDGNPFTYPYFIHDSYDSTDIINRFDWNKATNEELYPVNNLTREYTTGLIQLRRSSDAFRLGTMEEVFEKVTFIDAPEINEWDLIIGYKVVSSDGSEEYYVFVNADNTERTLTLMDIDLTEGKVIVDANEAGTTEVTNPTGFELTADNITLDPLTAVIVKVADETEEPGEPAPGDGDTEDQNPGDGDKDKDKDKDKEKEKEKDKDKDKDKDKGKDKDKDKDEKTGGSPKKPDIVNATPIVDGNKVTVPSEVVNEVAKNGVLQITLSKPEEEVQLTLRSEQINHLREVGGTIRITRDDLVINIPASIFDGNEEVIFTIKKLADMEKAISSVYSFHLQQGGKTISEFTDGIELSFEVDQKRMKNPNNAKVFYWNEKENMWELIGGSFKGGVVTATVYHFSTYAVFELSEGELNENDEEVTSVVETGNVLPDTATSIYNWLFAGIALLLSGISVYILQRRRVVRRS
ncbi:pullulanase [Evansella sp. AB-rgal1]|uniref:pullulanase n=1 Tax=Evansella sp. AB-rgal1 TaxID=3242696 RepID=UPI00359DB4F1